MRPIFYQSQTFEDEADSPSEMVSQA